MVYSSDGIPGSGDLVAHKILATLIIFNLNQEYSKLCGFVRVGMSIAIVSYNSLILCVPWYK